jgi:malate dehydrogenase (oxaloacetate-decarboxylating)(NADP+)
MRPLPICHFVALASEFGRSFFHDDQHDDVFTGSWLPGDANLLIMPNVDAANISYNLLNIAAGNGITVGRILLGTAKPVHVLEPAISVRRIVNMTALAVVDANTRT